MAFPNDPRPAIRREYVFGAGPSSGLASERKVLLVGNKTSAGTETVDVISNDPVTDDANAKARFGARSEWYAMYRRYVVVDPTATIFGLAPTQSAGVAASVNFTVATNADTVNGWSIEFHGEKFFYSPAIGDTPTTTAAAIVALINNNDGGRAQLTAGNVAGVITLTAAQNGPRGDLLLGSTADRGARIKPLGANAQTITKGALGAGGAEDDWTAAIAEMAQGEFYYHAIAKHAVTTVTAADNGIGEYMDMIRQQYQPVNGKDQVVFIGNVGTPSEAVAVAVSSALNSVLGKLVHQEKSDWTPAMIAAHHCAIVRQQEVAHPSANVNGWSASDSRIYQVPTWYLKADRPTYSEIVTLLNNGVSPIVLVGNRVVWERHITTRSLNELGSNDYRAREGHIPSATHFFWDIMRQRYESIRQPFADDDPIGDRPPPMRHTTPGAITAMLEGGIDDFTSNTPLDTYQGAILRPSSRDELKKSIKVTFDGSGGFPSFVDIQAAMHNLRWHSTINETSNAA